MLKIIVVLSAIILPELFAGLGYLLNEGEKSRLGLGLLVALIACAFILVLRIFDQDNNNG